MAVTIVDGEMVVEAARVDTFEYCEDGLTLLEATETAAQSNSAFCSDYRRQLEVRAAPVTGFTAYTRNTPPKTRGEHPRVSSARWALSRASSPHRPRGDELAPPCRHFNIQFADALALLSRWRLSKP
jgi:hypothetical protein